MAQHDDPIDQAMRGLLDYLGADAAEPLRTFADQILRGVHETAESDTRAPVGDSRESDWGRLERERLAAAEQRAAEAAAEEAPARVEALENALREAREADDHDTADAIERELLERRHQRECELGYRVVAGPPTPEQERDDRRAAELESTRQDDLLRALIGGDRGEAERLAGRSLKPSRVGEV